MYHMVGLSQVDVVITPIKSEVTERLLPDNLCAIPEHLHVHGVGSICMGHQV